MRAVALTFLVIASSLVLVVSSYGRDPSKGAVVSELVVATWQCQDMLHPDVSVYKRRTAARSPWVPHSSRYWVRERNLWTVRLKTCTARLHRRAVVLRAVRAGQLDVLTTPELYDQAAIEVSRGGIYSIAWGGASPLLRSLCYEAVTRAFGANASWARTIVNRESGCNPAATNTTYSAWDQRAKCIAQLIPYWHPWVDYARCQRDLRYSVQVFVHLSNGGASTGPWSA